MPTKEMVKNNNDLFDSDQNQKPIEDRVLRGVSFKTLLWIAMAVISSYGWLLNSLNGIEQDLNTIKSEKNGDSRVNDVNMKNLENKLDIQSIQIKDLQRKFEIILENQIK